MKKLPFLILLAVTISTHAQVYSPWQKASDNWLSSFSYCSESHPSGLYKSGSVTNVRLRNDANITLSFNVIFTLGNGATETRAGYLGAGKDTYWSLDGIILTGCQVQIVYGEVNGNRVNIKQLQSATSPGSTNTVPVNSGGGALKPMYFVSKEVLKRDGEKLTKNKYYEAAMFGDANAQYQLGREYAIGTNGLPVDLVSARTWLSWSENNGNADASILLKTLLPKKP